MNKLMYLLLFAFAMTMSISCGKNEGKNAITEMERIVEKAEKEKDNLTADEWKELAASFEENEKIINEAAAKGKLGVTDRMKLIALTARWAGAYGTSAMMDDVFERLEKELNTDGTSSDSLEEIVDSLKEALTGNDSSKVEDKTNSN